MQTVLTTRPSQDVIAAIQQLELDSVKTRLMDPELGKGWSREYADGIEVAYKTYLTMLVKYPDSAEAILLSKDVDEFWHTHILQTRKYARDCENTFGGYLHHEPHVGELTNADREKRQANAEVTRALYEREFGPRQGAINAWAGEVVSADTAAMSNVVIHSDRAAMSNVSIHPGHAAMSNVSIRPEHAAMSNVSIRPEHAAMSNVSIRSEHAAMSNVSIRPEHAAMSNVSIRSEHAAMSNVSIHPGHAAMSNVSIRPEHAAMSNVSIRSEHAAMSNVSIRPEHAAVPNAAVQ